MKTTAIIGLLLVILLITLSSYLRLDHSGIGCTPWPDCYGNIGVEEEAPSVENAYERLVAEARQPMSWARPLHRLVASVLGLLVLGLAAASVFKRRYRLASFTLLFLTVFLAWLGIYSEGLQSPAVVMGNLGGGFAMLAVFGWLVFELSITRDPDAAMFGRKTRRLIAIAIAAVCVQILLGGLTSANFAANACTTFPDCMGMWLPGSELLTAFDLARSHVVNEVGYVIAGTERQAIHLLHRWFAVVTIGVVSAACFVAIRSDKRLLLPAILVGAIIGAELAVGISAVLSNVPISVAVAHNWLAGLLLLGLIYLRAKAR